MLADTENSLTNTRSSLLRISGAIQVLEELLVAEEATADNGQAKDVSAEPVKAPQLETSG